MSKKLVAIILAVLIVLTSVISLAYSCVQLG